MWLYNFGLTLYVWLIRLVAPRHPKARLWIDGRKDLYKRMAETIDPTDRIVWVHVASLGEFEQGRPIIERIRKTHPEYKILLTFFSPSGYEVRKNINSHNIFSRRNHDLLQVVFDFPPLFQRLLFREGCTI